MENFFSSLPNPAGGAIPKNSKSKFYTSELSFEDNFNPSSFVQPKKTTSTTPDMQEKKDSFTVSTINNNTQNESKPVESSSNQAPDISSYTLRQSGSPLMSYVVRLKHGDELRKCLLSFVKKNGLKAAFIMTCVGSATSARIRVASAKPNDEANYVCTKIIYI